MLLFINILSKLPRPIFTVLVSAITLFLMMVDKRIRPVVVRAGKRFFFRIYVWQNI